MTKTLRDKHIVYHAAYGLFACLDCVKPLYGANLKDHLKTVHHYDKVSVEEIQQCLDLLGDKVIKYSTSGPHPWPTSIIPALEGIIVEQGYQCQFCNCAFRQDNSMKTHLRTKHEAHEREQWLGKKLPIGPMQSFSTGSWKVPFFQVTTNGESIKIPCNFESKGMAKAVIEQQDQIAEERLKRRHAQYMERALVSIHDPTAVDPWLTKMDWNRFLRDVLMSDWYRAANLIPGEMNVEDSILREQVRDLLSEAIRTTCSLNRLNRTTLNNPNSNSSTRPIRTVQTDTSRRYFDRWASFLHFLLYTTSDPVATAKYKVVMSPTQKSEVEKLRALLSTWASTTTTTVARQFSGQGKRKAIDQDPVETKWLEDIKETILRLSYLCLDEEILDDSFHAPLVAFSAASSININRVKSREPPSYNISRPSQYTSILVALRFCARIIVGHCSDRESKLAYPDSKELYLQARMVLVQERCQRFMMNSCSSPMAELQCRMAYAFSISRLDHLSENLTWLSNDLVRLSSYIVSFSCHCRSLQAYVKSTEEFLLERLLFMDSPYKLPSRKSMGRIVDNPFTREDLYWYGMETQNDLGPTFKVVKAAILNGNFDKSRYVHSELTMVPSGDQENTTIKWTRGGKRVYEKDRQEFLDRLMILVHMTSGQPARGRELMSIRWRNTPELVRNIQIVKGEVVFYTRYHKAITMTEKSRVISRFLPYEVGRLIVAYLSWVLPFQDFLDVMCGENEETKPHPMDFLWTKGFHPVPLNVMDKPDQKRHIIEQHLSSEYLSNRLRRWTRMNLNEVEGAANEVVLGIALYRQLAIAFARKKILEPMSKNQSMETAKVLAALKLLDEDGDDGSIDEDDIGEHEAVVDNIFDLQTCHTTLTSIRHYAREGKIWDQHFLYGLENFRQASRCWHQILGLEQLDLTIDSCSVVTNQLQFNQHSVEDLSAIRTPADITIRPFPPDYPLTTTPTVRKKMRELLKSDAARFKSADQARLYSAMLMGQEQKESVTAVMATNAGKTLPIQLASMLPGAKTTIVITPFTALMDDFLARCKEDGVPCTRWVKGLGARTRIIVVAAESMANSRELANDIAAWTSPDNHVLDRIVFDEVQVMISAFYRNLDHLTEVLPNINCQKVFLTGTLPPAGERLMLARCGMTSTIMLRCSTSRTNLSYRIEWVEDDKLSIDENGLFVDLLKTVMVKCQEIAPDEKIVVYTMSKARCQLLASALGCDYYHGDLSDQEKKDVLWRWKNSNQYKVVVATVGGFGTGVDYWGVRNTIHEGIQKEMVVQAQETGRAGRDGKPATCFFFCRRKKTGPRGSKWEVELPDDSNGTKLRPELEVERRRLRKANRQALKEFFQVEQCLRLPMTGFLDGFAVDCMSVGGDPCSFCALDMVPCTEAIFPLQDEGYTPPLWQSDQLHQMTLTQMHRRRPSKTDKACISLLSSSSNVSIVLDSQIGPIANRQSSDLSLQSSYSPVVEPTEGSAELLEPFIDDRPSDDPDSWKDLEKKITSDNGGQKRGLGSSSGSDHYNSESSRFIEPEQGINPSSGVVEGSISDIPQSSNYEFDLSLSEAIQSIENELVSKSYLPNLPSVEINEPPNSSSVEVNELFPEMFVPDITMTEIFQTTQLSDVGITNTILPNIHSQPFTRKDDKLVCEFDMDSRIQTPSSSISSLTLPPLRQITYQQAGNSYGSNIDTLEPQSHQPVVTNDATFILPGSSFFESMSSSQGPFENQQQPQSRRPIVPNEAAFVLPGSSFFKSMSSSQSSFGYQQQPQPQSHDSIISNEAAFVVPSSSTFKPKSSSRHPFEKQQHRTSTAHQRHQLFDQWSSLIEPLRDGCILCYVRGNPKMHTWAEKKELEREGECDTNPSFQDFMEWKRSWLEPGSSTNTFPKYSCCYRCYLPFDFCKSINDNVNCTRKGGTADIVLPTILLSRSGIIVEPTQQEIQHPVEEAEFQQWLREGRIECGIKVTNCFLFFLAVVKHIHKLGGR